ncbi:MAG: DNA primase, partial [Macromonas sp.]
PQARGGIVRREDRLARILLETPDGWDWLSADDQQLLGQLPAPHGPLFNWLECQWHEHGPQSCEDRLTAMQGEPFADWARTLPVQAEGDNTPPQPEEVRQELHELLRREHIEHLKTQETAAIAQAAHDPEALQHYRELQRQRRALEQLT